jgi:histidine triad (HIT) family protein
VADCTFCAILAGERSAHVVLDDDVVLAFLDIRPVFVGHVLVVPRTHVETLTDLPAAQIGPYFERVQRLAAAVPVATGAQGTFVAANNRVSQSVPHLHTHVVPRTKGDGLRGFFWPRTRYDDEDHGAEVAAAIASALRAAG